MTKAKLGSIGLSLLVLVLLVVWMVTGEVKVAREEVPEQAPGDRAAAPSVQVDLLQARLYEPALMVQGQLEPWRTVSVGARISGTVEELMVEQGDRVREGDVLLRLSEDGRGTAVEQWRSRIRKLEADLSAAERLRARDLASESEVLTLQSELAVAKAELARARLAMDHLTPRAPFVGTVNRRDVDLGDLVQVGSPLLELVRVDRLKATGQIPQQSVGNVEEGQKVSVRSLDGDTLEGRVSFVATAADRETRSFAVEVTVENPERKRVAGGSATLRISLPEVRAMFISPAYLSLDDDGRPGVRHVGENNEVVFSNVRLLNVTTDGAWVTGLPEEIRLITRGAGFVSVGQQVRPVNRDADRG
ncbi:efflux RND transporter periplasmic adaptor subunit [Marinobacter orientalis]|uniref:Efflux RND transporter periplasmic adaptor subunit n=1 Tax=Marinobacter orientalis TaxID=1928859 RepID=A0A7Y0RDM3_9GAMM|nr:efflux RND transporter periplasmic adaptor subunit [Marinobacter orientalis]NMT64305.1 efflux RND transporter periplasmic adaptor subunit [Marinobacter orientalis]TGX49518.1 efflux RND transporter periplasmic adaptor subunit [Marinobacter orientalis]